MKKLIAYIAMAAIIATLFCACGDGRIVDRPFTSPLISPEVNTEVTPSLVSPNVSSNVGPTVSPYISPDADNGMIEDNNGTAGDNYQDRDHAVTSPSVTAKP